MTRTALLVFAALAAACSDKPSDPIGGTDSSSDGVDTGGDTGFVSEDPPTVIECGQLFALTSNTPQNGAASVEVGTPILATFQAGGAVEEIEGDACDLTIEVRLVVDTDPSPSVLDWALLQSRLVWQYQGEGQWGLRVVPGTPLQAGETYAVEADFHVEGELPYGNVWTWSMAP